MTTPKCIVESLEGNCDFVCDTTDFLEPQIPRNAKHSVSTKCRSKTPLSRRPSKGIRITCTDPETKAFLLEWAGDQGLSPIEKNTSLFI